MRHEHSQPADSRAADRPSATSHPLSGSLFPARSRPQASESGPGDDAPQPSRPPVIDLVSAARLAVASHRAAAGECLEAEGLWRAALGGGDWQQHEGRWVEALRATTATRHRALLSLARLAAADEAEFAGLCETSELEAAGTPDGPTVRVTDLACDDRSARSLSGLIVVGVWREIDRADR